MLLYIKQVRPSLPARVLQWPEEQLFPGCWLMGHETLKADDTDKLWIP